MTCEDQYLWIDPRFPGKTLVAVLIALIVVLYLWGLA